MSKSKGNLKIEFAFQSNTILTLVEVLTINHTSRVNICWDMLIIEKKSFSIFFNENFQDYFPESDDRTMALVQARRKVLKVGGAIVLEPAKG